ncbi:adenosylcobinamide-phosphate synthase CbiB [Motilimonas cestriensis]|uniref:Cobalamin biosynthesis protein CobD n=1 Tax=Motilimonas cestriensis TaxID=2742685 RepID=A0ABS8WGU3_9GAMM|nr:adenosylcobinamide-phosphate synthase CbiB [Motilimonas cestriensis]MCE2596846.1 adenosylcobinamide-phosphate synthase CbiB [Motilimonas cestriensis]
MLPSVVIALAYFCDLIFADPYRIPHPVQGIGVLINAAERLQGRLLLAKKAFGVWSNLTVLVLIFCLSLVMANLHWLVEMYLLYTCLATRSLYNEGAKVRRILNQGDMALARKELSYLVSRDTAAMDQAQITRSAMETISENTVDGITAPLFYMCLGALVSPWLPGASLAFAMTYKAINTFDSMWGYKNERYLELGWFSARLDDWANWLPARLTGAVLLPLSALVLRYDWRSAWRIFWRDRLNHASPNSAHPEAAVAGALGVQLGGATSYFGQLHDKPTIGDNNKPFTTELINKNLNLMLVCSLLSLGGVLLVLIIVSRV